MILEDEFYNKASQIWNQENENVSSILTGVETIIIIRRFFKLNKKRLAPNWLSKNEKRLKDLLSECSLVKFDESILSIIESRKEISDCRSLDGIHVATAIFLRDCFIDSLFYFYSFDKRVNEVPIKYGLNPL